MHEQPEFDPEEAAFRAELIGNLKIDPHSSEAQRLLTEWRFRGETAVVRGERDEFDWRKEEIGVYLAVDEPEFTDAAIWVVEGCLVEARQRDDQAEINYFSEKLRDLGVDPEDSNQIYDA